jgi:hypothetical protein
MDEQIIQALHGLREALKALTSAAEKSLHVEHYRGTGPMHAKNYRRLHARAMELLPDDAIIAAYTLDDDDAPDERAQVAQVALLAEQMHLYLRGILRESRPPMGDAEDLRHIGGELRDQIINMTKRSLYQALSNIDLGFAGDEGEFDADIDVPHKRKVKVRVQVDKEKRKNDDPPEETINL